jgi:REP element-mobilizing transposase RayT
MIRDRKLLRLNGYDYATPGAYFITTCVHGHKNEFGIIENGAMQLNNSGWIINQQWKWLFDQYEYLRIGEYCVMPNHFHGIIWITTPVGNGRDATMQPVGNGRDRSLRDKPIPELIGAFKTTSSKLIHKIGNENFKWQKSFYDVIIRDDESLHRMTHYIKNNPLNWDKDDLFG